MYRILAVDDDPAILRSLRRGLRLAGFDVDTAGSGCQALEQAANRPDAIILDVSMPDVSAIEVCGRLREAGSQVPVSASQRSGRSTSTPPRTVSTSVRCGWSVFFNGHSQRHTPAVTLPVLGCR
ncbi:response regulator [Nonomuraea wenchangensis]